ncbi:translation initiation factor eIF2B subunit epsilon-like [Sycon ciliatum]|uniref:translation initiation factor eIF2B subunit epsilon-like n=1 Tax=Sycon ciliatum TaxID=27933 RepID=UPI0031F646E9
MPPKKTKGKGLGSSSAGDNKQRDIVQAVVVADSFNFRFLPITVQQPRALLPLANRPLIDYTLEFLVSSGVEEIIVVCRAHANLVRTHINTLKEKRHIKATKVEINVVCVGENSGMSAGDCLRELERQQLIRSDFVLVSGDVVSNVNLRAALTAHKARRAISKTSVMTLIVKEAPPHHSTRQPNEDDIVVAIEAASDQLLYFFNIGRSKKMGLPTDIFDREDVSANLRFDVLDCHISICSPEVPQLFTDNFDYSCRDDFIKGVLVHEEITGHKIHMHFIEKEYAARVSNLHTYDAITTDVIRRWTYPVVPDICIHDDTVGRVYTYSKPHKYIGTNVQLARDCTVTEDIVVGPNSKVGAQSTLANCVIGENCVIGKNVKINGAFIWDNVTIEDNCTIHKSIICSRATVHSGTTVSSGCILSYGVIVGPDIELPAGCKITTARQACTADSFSFDDDAAESSQKTESTESEESTSSNPIELGEQSHGYVFEAVADPDSDRKETWGLEPSASDTTCDDDRSDDEEDETVSTPESDGDGEEDDEATYFYREVLDSVQNALEEKIKPENLILEINGSKHAYNMTIEGIPLVLVRAIVMIALRAPADGFKAKLTSSMQYLRPVLLNYVRPEFQQKAITEMETIFLRQNIVQHFPFALHKLYDFDVLVEDSILAWSRSPLPSAEQFDSAVDVGAARTQAKAFVEWLENAEEESDDDDDDDEAE